MSGRHFQRLEENIMDIIAEQQAKLGYLKEPVRLYYPLSSLQHLTGIQGDGEDMNRELQGFAEEVKDTLGKVQVSLSVKEKDRFCLFCPEQASEYVHEHKERNPFIYELVQLFSGHGVTMEQVIALFEKQKSAFEVETIPDGDFDVAIHFLDRSDPYYYCFKDEGCHMIYHRFLPEDYWDLMN